MKTSLLFLIAVLIVMPYSPLWAHCQIPCGIYDDPAQFALMLQDVQTIEKSMLEIQNLSKAEKPDWNQLVRWVTNKDEHAQKLTDIVTFYFMTQRIKPASPEDKVAYEKYVKELTLLHQIMVYTMKAKQTTDLENCKKLNELITEFKLLYMGEAVPKTGK
jgi:nickel superoxide dismutase